jgi:membrane protein YdbS with pleckstrin-like domain
MSDKTQNINNNEKSNNEVSIDFSKYATYLLPFAIAAAVVAWFRNSNSNIIIRIFYVIIAYLINIFYFIYIIYRWFTYKPSH